MYLKHFLIALMMSAELNASADQLPTYNKSTEFLNSVRADDWKETSTQQTSPTQEYTTAYAGNFPKPQNVQQQPTGSLSGRLVFLISGHGWTYNEEQQLWYTQRGRNHGLVEDLANQDQATVFADYLWNAGATIIPLRPIGFQPEERVIGTGSSRTQFFGTWFDSDSPVHFGGYTDTKGAKFTKSNLQETALARFTPYIATPGLYPVYAWARDGADRVTQTYRVRHADGVTEVRLNHQMVGKGWMYLGTFPFKQGENGCVEITNRVTEPYDVDNGRVVMAEAIRFGNGRSNANLGGGIVGDTRETEGSNFWLQDSFGLGGNSSFVGSSTVGDPPKMSAHMNRESVGSYFDRIYWSFHSNASGSPKASARGAVLLWNQDAESRTDFQESLVNIAGRIFTDDLAEVLKDHPLKWVKRPNPTGNYINYGELRRDYLQNEMVSTLVEAAFHDNFEDASLLLEPEVRQAMARSCLRGILKWLNATDPRSGGNLRFIPQTPENLSATVPTDTQLLVSWTLPADNPILGEPAETVEVSVQFGNDTRVFPVPASKQSLLLDGFTTESLTLLTLSVQTANTGGKSIPSAKICASSGTKPKVLLVDAFLERSRSMNRKEAGGSFWGSVYGSGHDYERFYLPQLNPQNTVLALADTLTSNGISVESITATRLAQTDLSKYHSVYVLTGNSNIDSSKWNTVAVSSKLKAYATQGGRLIVAGAHAPSLMNKAGLLSEVFATSLATSTTALANPVVNETLEWKNPGELTLQDSQRNDMYTPQTMDTMMKEKNTSVLANHSKTGNPVAIYAKMPQGNPCVLMSFSPEQLKKSDDISNLTQSEPLTDKINAQTLLGRATTFNLSRLRVSGEK